MVRAGVVDLISMTAGIVVGPLVLGLALWQEPVRSTSAN
jgi:hypothetical protein